MMAESTTVQRTGNKFTMRGLPLLSSGQTTEPLVTCEHLWLHSKVYSRGGENALHAHLAEDHAFFVLQGAVEFRFGDGSTTRVEALEGMMVPKAVEYCFEAQGGENLVMLRMAGGTRTVTTSIVDADHNLIVDNASAAKGKTPSEPVVEIPGKFFGS
jgi:mannose-6-phosphate isomerase-like protein (cupin superfamily)